MQMKRHTNRGRVGKEERVVDVFANIGQFIQAWSGWLLLTFFAVLPLLLRLVGLVVIPEQHWFVRSHWARLSCLLDQTISSVTLPRKQ